MAALDTSIIVDREHIVRKYVEPLVKLLNEEGSDTIPFEQLKKYCLNTSTIIEFPGLSALEERLAGKIVTNKITVRVTSHVDRNRGISTYSDLTDFSDMN